MQYCTRLLYTLGLALALLSKFSLTLNVAAVWETSPSEATDAKNIYTHNLDWDNFMMLINTRHQNGLRLENLAPYLDIGLTAVTQKWAGSWRPGTDAMHVNGRFPTDQFLAYNSQQAEAGLGIAVARPYLDLWGNLLWAGIWRSASSSVVHQLYHRLTPAEFEAKVPEMHAKGFRIFDIFSYADNGVRYYGGIWMPGTDALYVRAGMTESELATWHAYYHTTHGLTMTCLESVKETVGQQFTGRITYIAVWRGWKGKDKGNQYLLASVDSDSNLVENKMADLHKQGLVLTTFSFSNGDTW
jgi:hypothetical protein